MPLLACLALLTAGFTQQQYGSPELIEAVKKGNIALTKQLLAKGASPNSRETLFTKTSLEAKTEGGKPYPGESVLRMALEAKRMPLAKLLVEKGADVNAPGIANWRPIFVAAEDGDFEMAKYLLSKGAKPNLTNIHGETALGMAAHYGHARVVELLLKHGANINGGTTWPPLVSAAYSGNKEVVKILLAKGANPNYGRGQYMSPLEAAYAQGNDEIAEMIRKAGGKGQSKKEIEKERDERRAKLVAAQKATQAEKLQPATLSVDDRAVLEAVLADLLKRDKRWAPFLNEGSRLVVIPKTAGYPNSQFMMDNQMNSELTPAQANEVTLEIRESWVSRNRKGYVLPSLERTNILMASADADLSLLGFDDTFPKAKGWVVFFLPGFSKDQTKALVRFSLGPSPHGAAGTCFLVKLNGKWSVKWADFAHYV